MKITELFRLSSNYKKLESYYFDREYYVSTHGRLKINGQIKNGKYEVTGYLCDYFTDVNGKGVRFKRHQIVQQTFCKEDYKDGYTIDHIKRVKKYDNSIFNLRWADTHTQVYNRENVDYKYKKVKCENDGKIFNSCQEAERYYDLVKNTVSRVARGDRNSIHGLIFTYI